MSWFLLCLREKKTLRKYSNYKLKTKKKNREIQQQVEGEENTPEMVMHLGLLPPEALDLSGGNILAKWKKFKQKYADYEIVTRISSKDSVTRVATLLTVIGNDAIDVFNTLTWDEDGNDKKIEKRYC